MRLLANLFLLLLFVGLMIWAVGFWWFVGGIALMGIATFAGGGK